MLYAIQIFNTNYSNLSLNFRDVIDRKMIFVALYEVDRSYSYLMDNFWRKQISNRFHERWLCESTLRCFLGCTIVKSLSDRIARDCLLHIMPELAEQFMVEANCPIFTQKFNNIRDESVVIPFTNFVQIFVRKPNERHQRWDYYLLTSKIRNILNHAIWIN